MSKEVHGKENKMGKKMKIAIGAAAGVVVLYFGFAVYFSSHFFIGTKINGKDCAFKTAQEAEKLISPNTQHYVITLLEREDKSEEILGEEIDLETQYDITTAKLKKKQNPLLWIGGLFHKSTYTATVKFQYNHEKLEKIIDKLDCMQKENSRKPVNAKVVYNQEQKSYELQEADFGTVVLRENLTNAFLKTIEEMGEEVNLEENQCYQEPELTSESDVLKETLEKANQYCQASVTYEMGDEKVVVDGEQIHTWIKLKKNGSVKLEKDKVKEYIDELAQEYDTFGMTRTFTTSYKKKKVTIDQGDYGWWMDRETETDELYNAISNGENITRKPAYRQEAAQYGKNDIGDTYVEINLTTQHLFLYEDGKLILESDVVTGKPDGKHNTPPGVYGMTYTERNATLRGPGYVTPVSYWMPFNGDIGLHDATWQSAFGGERYKIYGSHGCVNLPLSVAQEIFEHAYTNMPVVCYFLEVKDDKKDNKDKPQNNTTTATTQQTTKETTTQKETTKKQKETTKKEKETTKKQKETTKKQKETTKKQQETTKKQKETTTKANNTTTKPSQDSTSAQETSKQEETTTA